MQLDYYVLRAPHNRVPATVKHSHEIDLISFVSFLKNGSSSIGRRCRLIDNMADLYMYISHSHKFRENMINGQRRVIFMISIKINANDFFGLSVSGVNFPRLLS